MPLDYSKWQRLLEQAKDDEDDEDRGEADEREWAELAEQRAREEGLLQLRAQLQEQQASVNLREREEYLKTVVARDVAVADESWMFDVDLDSYEDFTIKRTWRVVKVRGSEHFKAGKHQQAEQQWLGGVQLVEKVGTSWPTASELVVQLRCNLAQLYIKQSRWAEANKMASAALEVEPGCEKALYRRGLIRIHYKDWAEARRDLEKLVGLYPENAEAAQKLDEVKEALRREGAKRDRLKGVGMQLSNAIEELTPDGTLRKICVMAPGEERPEDLHWVWPWGREEWLGPSREKAVITAHVVVRSVGGEELFSTRTRLVLPESPQERDELRYQMQQVAELDDRAGKVARTPTDFYDREALHPMRWRYGDPAVYSGFDLAARSMRLGERAVFEIDQPLLEPSVCEFYKKDGGAARVAGLPSFKHHIEERKLSLLAEELPEWELDLESKTQRTVRVELELLSLELCRDMSTSKNGEYLLRIAQSCSKGGRRLHKGQKVVGDFVIAGALSGKALYHVQQAVWVIGSEGQESFVDRPGQRPAWIPKCIGQMFRDANWALLCEGARLEARLQDGPAPMELNPALARDLNWKRAFGHRPPVAISVDFFQILEG